LGHQDNNTDLGSFFIRLKSSPAYKLIRNSLLYGVGDLLQKFLSVLLIPIYTRYLEPSDYGILALLSILTLVVSTLTMCGLTNGISRYFYYADEQNATKAEVIWSPLIFVFFLTIIVIAILVIFAEPLSNMLFDSSAYRYLVMLTLINVLISNLSSIGRSVLIVEERVLPTNIINICGVLVGVASGLTLVVYLGRGVQGVVEAGLIGSSIMALFSVFFALQGYVPAFNATILKKQLRFSLPLVAAVFAFLFIDSSDRYLLKLYLPLSEVGLYNIGYQAGMLMMLLVGGFSSAWPPYYHRNNQNGEGQQICAKVLNLYLVGAVLFAVMISLGAPLALQLLTPQSYHAAYTVVPWVALAYMLKGPYIILLMGVLMKNKTSWQLYLEGFAAVVNIGLNILLIPIIGREAAAITTLLSYAIMVGGAYFMVNRINPIPNLLPKKIIGVIIAAIVVSGIALIPGYPSASLWIAPMVMALFIPFLFLLFRNEIRLLTEEMKAK
jgi:O-antigen/teichoic acid export membrane protein